MTIKKDTPIARRKDPEIDGVYDWDTYGSNTSFIQEVGHHAPTLGQLTEAGWLLSAETVFDPLTHKLVEPYAESWGGDGVYVTRKTVALMIEEITAKAAAHINTLLVKLSEEANRRVDLIINPVEKPHWMGVSDALARQFVLWLDDQKNDIPNPVLYPPLTDDEHQIWFSLSLVQKNTCGVREAAMAIAADLHQKTGADILLITLDDIADHILWP